LSCVVQLEINSSNVLKYIVACASAEVDHSSIIQAQFRLTKPSEGDIIINGVRINDIGLHDLRQSFKVLLINPQGPVVFSGTMKYNWDPLGQ